MLLGNGSGGFGSATNFNVLWHVDLGTRLFITKWLALQVYIKDYMMVDKLEPTKLAR